MGYRSWRVWERVALPFRLGADRRGNPAVWVAAAISLLSLSIAAQAQSKTATPPKHPAKSAGSSSDNADIFRNPAFGFRFQIPFGWVDRTKEMQEAGESGKTEVLLAVFERPPNATGETINSAVVIAAESAASYPGLKSAEDYLGPLTELATAGGLKADGEPYALEVESRQLLRADFVKTINDKLTMRQCTLVLLTRGQIISFTFITGSADELDQLMDGLHFEGAKKGAKPLP